MRIFAAIVALCAAGLLFVAYRHWLLGDPRQASRRTIIAAVVILLLSTAGAFAGGQRAHAQWGGPDLGISCETVRAYRAEIEAMPAKTKAALAESFGITRKQRRQAMACLRVN